MTFYWLYVFIFNCHAVSTRKWKLFFSREQWESRFLCTLCGELSSWIPSFTAIPYALVAKISERKDDANESTFPRGL